MIVCPQQQPVSEALSYHWLLLSCAFGILERQPSQAQLWSCTNARNTGVQKGCVLQASDLLLGITELNLEHVFLNTASGMRQVSLWNQPKAFAVKGVRGVSWCEALSEGSQTPRMLCLDYFFPCFLGFVLSPGSGLSPGSISHIALLSSSEEQVMAEIFTVCPLVATANHILQAGQLLESEMFSHVLFTKF